MDPLVLVNGSKQHNRASLNLLAELEACLLEQECCSHKSFGTLFLRQGVEWGFEKIKHEKEGGDLKASARFQNSLQNMHCGIIPLYAEVLRLMYTP